MDTAPQPSGAPAPSWSQGKAAAALSHEDSDVHNRSLRAYQLAHPRAVNCPGKRTLQWQPAQGGGSQQHHM